MASQLSRRRLTPARSTLPSGAYSADASTDHVGPSLSTRQRHPRRRDRPRSAARCPQGPTEKHHHPRAAQRRHLRSSVPGRPGGRTHPSRRPPACSPALLGLRIPAETSTPRPPTPPPSLGRQAYQTALGRVVDTGQLFAVASSCCKCNYLASPSRAGSASPTKG